MVNKRKKISNENYLFPKIKSLINHVSKNTGPLSKKDSKQDAGVNFPVLGISNSTGGLGAIKQFFTCVLPDRGMAFVLMLHPSLDIRHSKK